MKPEAKAAWSAYLTPTVIALVLANVAPLLCVLLLGWQAGALVLLYWFENVLIGVVNVLKMLSCSPDLDAWAEGQKKAGRGDPGKPPEGWEPVIVNGLRFGMAAFFALHYGMFCFVHGVFVCVLMNPDVIDAPGGFNPLRPALAAFGEPGFAISAAVLAASHLYSYAQNFLRGGEYLRADPATQMKQPYARVVLLHVAIIAGGFLVATLGSPVWLLVLLVVGKVALDIRLHLREHRHESPLGGGPLEGAMTTT